MKLITITAVLLCIGRLLNGQLVLQRRPVQTATLSTNLKLVTVKPTRECPPNRDYNECGTACPNTCDNLYDPPRFCTLQCVAGCFCRSGLVALNDVECVPREKCPNYVPPDPPYEPTEPPYEPSDPPYEPSDPPYEQTTAPRYPPPYTRPPPTEPYPTETYPYDPYEPYDPYDPYPFYFCEINQDEYGRPYYGPYDEYRRPPQYPPPPTSYPTPPTYTPSYPPPSPSYPPPTAHPPSYPPPTLPPPIYPYPQPTYDLPPQEAYRDHLQQLTKRKKRQVLTLPGCVTSNECNDQPATCTGYGTRYDRCGRRCTCRNGRLVDCCRVRKEWRSMTQVERCRYVDVVYTASTQQPWKRCYDELIKVHRDFFGAGIHGPTFFLPWHRWYILALENLLRQIDCRITVPYWDWSLEPQTWQNSIVWAAGCGLGENGVAPNDFVQTGVFRQNNWQITPSATSNFLQRDFNGNVPDCASVAMVQRQPVANFNTWHTSVSSNLHDSVHCFIGGTMCSVDSANAPEFFLHHGFIDKIWADWQNKGPGYKNLPFYTANNTPMPGAFGYSPNDVYDLDNQPGCVRVCVEPSSRPCRLNTTYTPLCPREISCYEYSPLKLAYAIPRPYPRVPEAAYRLFNTPYEIRRISNRFSYIFGNEEQLHTVLQDNGYTEGANTYRPPQGELLFDRYVYQAEILYRPTYAPNGTAVYPPDLPPPECQSYNKK